jgi:hypothetical protein
VSDFESGFSVTGTGSFGAVVEGDAINVTCGASLYKYKWVDSINLQAPTR